ncbi:MAG: glycosyltransferase [Phycisphaerae bacterium]|nr:glycosyltransferase [Phycisphaerae bacterium]NIT57837.1 glycosyltransferase [Fodinibius sp.]NIU58801.1 glycosyltransferase [Phycisphaerae bacterium]NIV12710.1 glycosyltransferase [Fodinibius sp.]NIW95074.1 glycosyltransferase [Phycisphaerae bacterium]
MISIITSTRNSFLQKKGSLELMLKSLKKQAGLEDYELIVVDNGSNDDSIDFLESFKRDAPFQSMKIIKNDVDVSNRSRSRNIACQQADGDFFLFIDDDVILPDKNILSKVRRFAKEGFFATGASRCWTYINWRREVLLEKIEKEDWPKESQYYFLPMGIKRETGYRDLFEYSFIGNFGLVDRKNFFHVGGFDEKTFDGWGREDVDLMLRLYLDKIKFRLLFDDIWIIHLNHSLRRSDAKQRSKSFEKYKKRESELGFVFKVNHLYGVFENDGTAILEPLNSGDSLIKKDLAVH